MTFITAKEEPKQRAPKEKKRPPWAPPPQHNFLKNWQHHLTLRKKQQEALSGEQSRQGPMPGLHLAWRLCCVFLLSLTCAEPGPELVTFGLLIPKSFFSLKLNGYPNHPL
jgi:hypothetical protein